jgi:hypothetical protein
MLPVLTLLKMPSTLSFSFLLLNVYSAPINQSGQQNFMENRDMDKKSAVFCLIAVILFSVGPVFNFSYYRILHFQYTKIVPMLYNITQIAGLIFGIVAFAKSQKIIGAVIGYTVIILLAVVSVINMYYLFQNLKG